jgi:hypothetical protein
VQHKQPPTATISQNDSRKCHPVHSSQCNKLQYVNEFAAIVDGAFSLFSALINKQLEALPAKMMDTAGARVEVALVWLQNNNREFQPQGTLTMQTFQQEIVPALSSTSTPIFNLITMTPLRLFETLSYHSYCNPPFRCQLRLILPSTRWKRRKQDVYGA